MSKKSTSRTGSDGDVEHNSTNDTGSSSEKSKSNLRLSHKEEATLGPSGDYTSKCKNLTENLDDSVQNQKIQKKSQEKNCSSESSDLDEALYGTSDAFNKNLEYLRQKLFLLEIPDTDGSPVEELSPSQRTNQTSGEEGRRNIKGYLSTRETLYNLSSPLNDSEGSAKHVEEPNVTKAIITTIYEAPELQETDRSNSTDSYKVPVKKLRFGDETPRLDALSSKISSNNLNLSLRNHIRNVSPHKSPSRTTSGNSTTDLSSASSGITYVVPFKRRCIKNKTPVFSNKVSTKREYENLQTIPAFFSRTTCTQCSAERDLSEEDQVHLRIKLPSEGETNSFHSWSEPDYTLTQRTKSGSLSGNLELSLNLPSSLITDCTSSDKTTPLEPNIITIDTSNDRRTSEDVSPSSLVFPYSAEYCASDKTIPSSGKPSAKIIHNKKLQRSSKTSQVSTSTVTFTVGKKQERSAKAIQTSDNTATSPDLPSKIRRECKVTPLEPNIIILNTVNIQAPKFKWRRKVHPIADSSPSIKNSSTCLSKKCSGTSIDISGDNSEIKSDQRVAHLLQKYYEDTPDLSNASSTSPFRVSVSESSKTSTDTTKTTGKSRKSVQYPKYRKFKDKLMNLKTAEDMQPKVFNPLFDSSLDLPKISMHAYTFPAISKMASFPGSFVEEASLGDNSEREMKEEWEKSPGYRKKAETLLSSPSLSLTRKTSESGDDFCYIGKDIKKSNPGIFSKNRVGSRKVQSTELSFYSVSTNVTVDEQVVTRNSSNDVSDVTTSDEAHTDCCCLKFLFPKRKRNFFS